VSIKLQSRVMSAADETKDVGRSWSRWGAVMPEASFISTSRSSETTRIFALAACGREHDRFSLPSPEVAGDEIDLW
jgi:hypothetical protein